MTIDDYSRAIALSHQLEASVPFNVRPGKPLLKLMKEKGNPMSAEQYYTVDKVFYGGDEGGITCMLQPNPTDKEMVGASITHLIIEPQHPLAEAVKAYQQQRSHQLWLQNQRGFAALAKKPLSKPKKKKKGGRGFGSR